MGNSQAKEARSSFSPSTGARRHHSSSTSAISPDGGGGDLYQQVGPDNITQVAMLEHRRETRQEREARRQERERVVRIRERERSMREEHTDGGYLVTQGVYVGPEDFNKVIVRQLMVCYTLGSRFCFACFFAYNMI